MAKDKCKKPLGETSQYKKDIAAFYAIYRKPDKKTRICLGCDREFLSRDKYNRRCSRCKTNEKQNDYKEKKQYKQSLNPKVWDSGHFYQ